MSEILFSEIYRPKKLEDAILPKNIKEFAQNIIKEGKIPNLLFYGKSGTGKTTLAKILAEQLGYDYIYINASLEGRSIDTVRTTITNFATGTTLGGGKKLVVLDEFCGCTPIVQDSLKGFFEQYSSSCSFILTANNKHKINAPILSRFSDFEFVIPADEKEQLKIEMMKRVAQICKEQSIRPEKEAIVGLVNKYFPDFRKTLNQLQKLTTGKTLVTSMLENLDMDSSEVIQLLRRKDFMGLRKLVATTSNLSVEDINHELWKHVDEFIKPQSIPSFVVLLSDYNVKANNVADQEVIIMAEFVEIMSQIEFI